MYSIKHKEQSEEIDALTHLLGTGDTKTLIQQNRLTNIHTKTEYSWYLQLSSINCAIIPNHTFQ